MIVHPKLKIVVVSTIDDFLSPWLQMGAEMAHVQVDVHPVLPDSFREYDAVVTCGFNPEPRQMLQYVQEGGGWLVMPWLKEINLPAQFGVKPGPVGPPNELRIMFKDAENPMAIRLPDALYVPGQFHPIEVFEDDVEILLYTDWKYYHRAMWTTRSYGKGQLACTTLQDYSNPMLQQICHRLLRYWQGSAPSPTASLGVGILGYAPSVGQPHGLAFDQVPGLHLKAICDLSEQRLQQATRDFPRVTLYDDSAALAGDDEIDLVIVATAPNIHAQLSIQMMEAGKHVLCEKPLALNRQQTEAMEAAARENGVHLSCHQNRRWDPDFRCIKELLENGRIGDVFHLETFVGGYHHPCGYWHSDSAVSGGTSYDWGAHYLDWIVGMLDKPVAAVMGSRHKRVWHDVTNADQERILIRFADGCEAEFIHSDIASIRKPKWYILGTEGAIIGDWHDVIAHEADSLYYFQRTAIPATEMMPKISLYQRNIAGDIEEITPVLPERDPFAFHRNLADHLLWGEPLAAPLVDSVQVVAILEAAARSMANNSSWEVLDAC